MKLSQATLALLAHYGDTLALNALWSLCHEYGCDYVVARNGKLWMGNDRM
jgi:hypothetical protein